MRLSTYGGLRTAPPRLLPPSGSFSVTDVRRRSHICAGYYFEPNGHQQYQIALFIDYDPSLAGQELLPNSVAPREALESSGCAERSSGLDFPWLPSVC